MRMPLALLLVPSLIVAQEAPKPALSFNKLHHAFGRIPADRKVAYRFKATNGGQAPLQIKQVLPSCGCTYTMLGQWHLKPGESTELEATFDPKGMRGLVRKSMQVVSDDPVNPVITLSFEAEVIQDIMPSTTVVFFDAVPRSATRKATLRLESGNGQPVQVLDAKAAGAPYLTATTRQEGKDVVMEVAFDARKVPASRNFWTDTLTVRTTSERMGTIPIQVQWQLRPSVVATPGAVAWVEASGTDLRRAVQLKQVDGKPFRVLGAKATSPLVRVEGIGQAAAPQQEVVVILSKDAKTGRYSERLTLTLDDPEQPELELRVSAALR